MIDENKKVDKIIIHLIGGKKISFKGDFKEWLLKLRKLSPRFDNYIFYFREKYIISSSKVLYFEKKEKT